MNNRILIASPIYGKVSTKILEDWMRFAYYCGRRLPDYDFYLGIKSKSEQFRARNMIVEGAQQHDCDRILMMDDDMVIDWQDRGAESYGFLKTLLDHQKPICGVLYYQRGQECNPVLMQKLNDKGYRFLRDDEITHRLQRVDVAGGGCLLIETRVFDRIAYPYFAPEYEFGTDIQLCRKAAEKGFEIWADTSIELGHIRYEETIISSQNRHQFQETPSATMKNTFVTSELYALLMIDAMEYTKRQSLDEMEHEADSFMDLRKSSGLNDADWYRQYPMERISRQVWYNSGNSLKKMMTSYILGAIQHNRPFNILDFGCGIGITAFALAEKGHRVTACDIRGTGTFEFLKWRTAKHGVPMRFIESEGGVPQLTDTYDVIIAMDSLEHIADWRGALRELAAHLRPGGMLFSNNAIMENNTHQEHYPLSNKDFVAACMDADLWPFTQIAFIKREPIPEKEELYAESAN